MRRVLIVFGIWLLVTAAYLGAAYQGWLGEPEPVGRVTQERRTPESVATASAAQRDAARAVDAPDASQILFGDLHVHSTYSMDAFLKSLPLLQGEGAHPPADACDFARFCSALDFFSLNDHAEGLTPAMWRESIESIRACDAVSGDPANPDLVPFLGWEWTQIGTTPASHYGHKNVVLRDLGDDAVPTRPIAAEGGAFRGMRQEAGRAPTLALAMMDFENRQRYYDLAALRDAVRAVPVCPKGVPVRDLPADCTEAVATPRELFARLDEWGFPALVIPHGNAWGNTTPAGVSWDKQLADGNHDPDRQTLIEVYSGHGNSELLRPWRHVSIDAAGNLRCPDPSPGFTPGCWQAGEIIRKRCGRAGLPASECDVRVEAARSNFLSAAGNGHMTIPGQYADDWLDSGQCTDCFQPAFDLRPGGSTQYAIAITGAGVPGADADARFRFGFIGSSDTHFARAGSGYKEFAPIGMTDLTGADAVQRRRMFSPVDDEPRPESVALDLASIPMLPGGNVERSASFYYTGGLAAVHASGRDRGAIWDALLGKEVYGTSGPRILLWFDLLEGQRGDTASEPAPRAELVPMGGSVELGAADVPRFRVRAVGSFVQKPGCPDEAVDALGATRLDLLCKSECYHPSETRHVIRRIEVVRIRPRRSVDEDPTQLVEDPWLTLPCPMEAEGCTAEFSDLDFGASGRDAIYYVRALQEPTPQINAAGLRCEHDESGACTRPWPCRPGLTGAPDDTCLAPDLARAWSSPIFVDFDRATVPESEERR